MGQFFDSKPNVLLATLTGETAFRVAAQDIEITKQEVRNALTSMYGEFRPEIIDILVPDWASNPLYRGSYADTPIGLRYQTQDIIAAPVGKLYFGGGVTNKLYTDYVHGAYLAGVDVANSILRDMSITGELTNNYSGDIVCINIFWQFVLPSLVFVLL